MLFLLRCVLLYLILMSSILTYTTTPTQLTDALETDETAENLPY